jgi:multiple sugar transport system permease protein
MKRKMKEMISGYLYILPSFVLIMIFSVIPIFMTIFFSFTKYNVIQPPQFIGLDNYKYMMKDTFILASIKNTIVYTVMVVPIQTFLALIIAQIIADKFRNKFGQIVKSSLFIPVISSAILVGTLWSFLLSTDSGMINAFLSVFGIPKVNWLGTTQTALLSVAMVSIWKNVGYFLVIYYAGIMDIPASLYEAADIDGANKMQCFRYITIPHLKPITFLVVTLGTIWSFQVFDIVYVMTAGGPGKSTVTLVLTIYRAAFKQYNMGYASATATLLLAIIMVITMLQKLLFREKKEVKS